LDGKIELIRLKDKLGDLGSDKTEIIGILIDKLGKPFYEVLNIKINSGDKNEVFKWFLASILFGARISETIAMNTFKEIERRNLVTPEKIRDTEWEELVDILDKGGYTRYDFKTADKLLEITKNLIKEYGGDLNILHKEAENPEDLELKIKKLGKGVGDITVSIFLRELRNIWEKADPRPTPLVILAAKNIGLIKFKDPNEILKELKKIWSQTRIENKKFINFETSLLRLGKDYCRKDKCRICFMNKFCIKYAGIVKLDVQT
jgi:endonuclease III